MPSGRIGVIWKSLGVLTFPTTSFASFVMNWLPSLGIFLDDRFHETCVVEQTIGWRIPCFAIGQTRSGIMAGWRRAVESTMTDEEIERLTVLSRSRTESASRVSR